MVKVSVQLDLHDTLMVIKEDSRKLSKDDIPVNPELAFRFGVDYVIRRISTMASIKNERLRSMGE